MAVAAQDDNYHEQWPKAFGEIIRHPRGGPDRATVYACNGKVCSAGVGQAVAEQGDYSKLEPGGAGLVQIDFAYR